MANNNNNSPSFGPKKPSNIQTKTPGPQSDAVAVGFGQLLWGWKGNKSNIEQLKSGDPNKGLFGKINNILGNITSVIPEARGKAGIRLSDIKPEVIKKVNEEFIKNLNKEYNPDKYSKWLANQFQTLSDLLDPKKIKIKSKEKSSGSPKVQAAGEIKIAITGAGDLNNLIETLKKNDFKIDKDAIKNIEFLADKLNDLGQYINELHLDADPFEDLSKIGTSLSDLNKGFSDISSTQRIVKQLI